MNGRKLEIQRLSFTVILVAVLLLGGSVVQASPAYAYFELPGPYVNMGSSAVSVEVGYSVGVSCLIDPVQEQQMKGCGVDYCPQKCNASCIVNGWCRCDGETYYTYVTNIQVSSSNTGVAGAAWANGMLTVYGNSAGTAVITVSTSLDKHVGSQASLTVTVTQPAYVDNSGGSAGGVQQGGGSQQTGPQGGGGVTGGGSDVVQMAPGSGSGSGGGTRAADDIVRVVEPGRRTADGVPVGVAKVDEDLTPFDVDSSSTRTAGLDLLGLSTVTATMAGAAVPLATEVIQRPLLMPTPVPLMVVLAVFVAAAAVAFVLVRRQVGVRRAAQPAARAAAREKGTTA